MATTTTTIVTEAGPSFCDTTRSIDIISSPPASRQQDDTASKTASIAVLTPANGKDNGPPASANSKPFKPTWRLWAVLGSIAVIAICGTLEATIIVNALPTIVSDLGGGNAFLWVPNAYYLASVATLPLVAQMSDIFGRRYLLMGSMALFIFGSGLCSGSNTLGMLIASRAIQGMGAGGCDVMVETIINDLVPLRERSKYLSIVMIGSTLGACIGPFLGGVIVVKLGWRWIFYLNVILGGTSFVLLAVFLRVKHKRNETFIARLKRIDVGGNAIFIGSVVAVLLALTWGGPVYDWDSYHILLPLILGLVGFVAFTAFEWTPKLAPEPSFPRALVSNRTSAAVIFQTFVDSILTMWTFYFYPIYFQGILGKSVLQSGIAIVPISACVVPFIIVGGIILSKYGRYKAIHAVSWAILVVGLGLSSLLDRDSSKAAWVCFQIIVSAGVGFKGATMLPALQAPLDEKFVATSSGLHSFARGFGAIWGVTIPTVIFNNEARQHANLISDKSIADRFTNSQAYEVATKKFLDTLVPISRDQVIEVFTRSIKSVWYVGIAFAAVAFLAVFLEKEVKLRTELNTEFGMDDERRRTSSATDVVQLEDLPARSHSH